MTSRAFEVVETKSTLNSNIVLCPCLYLYTVCVLRSVKHEDFWHVYFHFTVKWLVNVLSVQPFKDSKSQSFMVD